MAAAAAVVVSDHHSSTALGQSAEWVFVFPLQCGFITLVLFRPCCPNRSSVLTCKSCLPSFCTSLWTESSKCCVHSSPSRRETSLQDWDSESAERGSACDGLGFFSSVRGRTLSSYRLSDLDWLDVCCQCVCRLCDDDGMQSTKTNSARWDD